MKTIVDAQGTARYDDKFMEAYRMRVERDRLMFALRDLIAVVQNGTLNDAVREAERARDLLTQVGKS